MRKLFLILFYSSAIFFVLSCQKASSQKNESLSVSTNQSFSQTFQIEPNRKYKLSLIFEPFLSAPPPAVKIKIRHDLSGKEFDLYVIDEGNLPLNARRFWSPDEEYIIFHHNALTVYPTTELLKYLNKPDFSFDNFLKKAKSVSRVEILSDKQNPEFRHTFLKWENNGSFSFKISQKDRTEPDKFNEFAFFRYDLETGKLYRQVKKHAKLPPEVYSLIAKDKKGIIKSSRIRDEIID
jgi:hypothetical protein